MATLLYKTSGSNPVLLVSSFRSAALYHALDLAQKNETAQHQNQNRQRVSKHFKSLN